MNEYRIPENARRPRASILYRDRFIRVIFGAFAFELEDAHDIVRIGQELHAAGGPVPVMCDLRYVRSISADARAHMAGPTGVTVAPAIALIISSPLSRAIGNFYLGFNRPRVPTRLFTSFEAAESWLDGFLSVEDAA